MVWPIIEEVLIWIWDLIFLFPKKLKFLLRRKKLMRPITVKHGELYRSSERYVTLVRSSERYNYLITSYSFVSILSQEKIYLDSHDLIYIISNVFDDKKREYIISAIKLSTGEMIEYVHTADRSISVFDYMDKINAVQFHG